MAWLSIKPIPCDRYDNTRWNTFTNEYELSFGRIGLSAITEQYPELYLIEPDAFPKEIVDFRESMYRCHIMVSQGSLLFQVFALP